LIEEAQRTFGFKSVPVGTIQSNEEKVPGRMRAAKGWSSATVSRILDNEKYVGRWVWNKTESRRDPRTGRRRRFTKPESESLRFCFVPCSGRST